MLIGNCFDIEPQKIFNLEDYLELIKENFYLKETFVLNLLLNFIKDLKEEIISIDFLSLNYFSGLSIFPQVLDDICNDEEKINLEKHSFEIRNANLSKKQKYRRKYNSYIVELCLKYYKELKQEFKCGKFPGVYIRYV